MNSLVTLENLKKLYQTGEVKFEALKGISLQVVAGDFIAIMGHSGSGKSTLLHLIGGLDRPSEGTIQVNGHQLHRLNETALAKFRRAHIGFVFQFFNLIDNLTVQANVELPALLANGQDKKTIRRRSNALLERLGIATQTNKHPWELSGGQQQRVAIARALINQPPLLLADEPTGNLDSASGEEVLRILGECNQQGQTILMVTHDALAAARAKCVLFIHDGYLMDSMPGGEAEKIAQRLINLKHDGGQRLSRPAPPSSADLSQAGSWLQVAEDREPARSETQR